MRRLAVLSTLASLALPVVSVAALNGNPEENLRILESIPLFQNYEKRVSGEDDKAETLVEIFTKIQNEGRTRVLERGTHSKGSCFNGELKVLSAQEIKAISKSDDVTIARVRQGLFSREGVLPTTVRFANAKGQTNPDTVGDVRGLSLSVDTTGRGVAVNGDAVQDYMFNSSPMFAVRNIVEFTELLKAARLAQGDFYFLNPLYIKSTLRAKNLLEEFERNDTVSYAVESYWSNVPYSHGLKADGSPREIVKLKMSPCDPSSLRREGSAGKAPDYLQKDIDLRAARGHVCMVLSAQLFDQKKIEATGLHSGRKTSDWIENGGELWDEKTLPFVPVARLTITGDDASAVTSSKKFSCETFAISTLIHSQRGHQPLGSLARVRSIVEENSRARRMNEKR
ncbi:MAG: catalase [Bdellovibrionota bacterium]